MKEFERGWRAGLEAASKVADEFASVNWEMCHDSLLHDRVLMAPKGGIITMGDVAKAKDLQVDGTIASSMAHAAQNIAATIRKMKRTPPR